jgi:exopolysaccharide biosynthesis polyprenyl glycosylphosphotransferase
MRSRPAETWGPVVHRYPHRDYWRRRLLAAADVLGLVAAFSAAVVVVPRGLGSEDILWLLASLPVWVVLFLAYGLYDRELKRISHASVDDIPWLFHAMLLGAVASWAYFRVVPGHTARFSELALFLVTSMVLILGLRTVTRRVGQSLLAPERVLLIGDERIRSALVGKLRAHPEYGVDVVGILAVDRFMPPEGLPVLGGFDDLPRVAHEQQIDRVVVSSAGTDANDQVELMRRCRELRLKISLLPQVFDAMGPTVEIDDVEGVTVLGLNPPVLGRSSRIMKRSMDLLGAGFLLILVSPLMLLIAIAIKVTSRGPVFFKQSRVGRKDRRFKVIKFRTMYADAEQRLEELRHLSKDPNWLHLEHDPRITGVGRLLRMTSLDELPQLWNVVRGQMSLVGPRPLIESEDKLVDGWGRSRLTLTPGITGSWQVLGRTSIPFEEMVKLDYLYVANWTVWGDIRLILRTLPAILTQRGAN